MMCLVFLGFVTVLCLAIVDIFRVWWGLLAFAIVFVFETRVVDESEV